MPSNRRRSGNTSRSVASHQKEEEAALSRIVQQQIRAEYSVTKSSPIPDADELARYEAVLTGAAERIFRRWEAQADHRQDLERRVIESDISNSRLGLILGFIIEIAAVVLAAILAFTERELAGGLLGAAGLLSLGGTTIFVTIHRSRERRQRFDSLTRRIDQTRERKR